MGVPRIHSRRLLWTAVVLSMMALIAFFGRDARATTTVPDVVTAANRSSLPIVLNVPFVPPKLKLVPFTFGFENKSITVIAHAGTSVSLSAAGKARSGSSILTARFRRIHSWI